MSGHPHNTISSGIVSIVECTVTNKSKLTPVAINSGGGDVTLVVQRFDFFLKRSIIIIISTQFLELALSLKIFIYTKLEITRSK